MRHGKRGSAARTMGAIGAPGLVLGALLCGVPAVAEAAHGVKASAPATTSTPAKSSATAKSPAPAKCDLPDAFFTARLRGAIDREVRWRAKDMSCEGMNRPDRLGLRVAFSGRAGRDRLTFVLGMPRLAEGADTAAVPANVTVIREGGALYGTRGVDKCTLDAVRQTGIDVPPTTTKPRRWRIEARGFCLEPARGITNGGEDAILVATFDFAGTVTWEPDAPSAPPASTPSAAPGPTPTAPPAAPGTSPSPGTSPAPAASPQSP